MRKNLKEARQKAGMTQKEVAEYLEKSGLAWKIIQDGILIVCEDGCIYRKYRDGWKLFTTESNAPYIHIGINDKGKQKMLSAHRLVAEAFIPNPYKYEQVNHIDGNTRNNHVSNLEWCDAGYNVRDAKKRHAPKYLTNLRKIRLMYGFTIGCMSRHLGILQGMYSDIENGITKPIPLIANELERMYGESIEFLLAPVEDE